MPKNSAVGGTRAHEARAQLRPVEHAHDERNAEAEALRRVGEAVGALFDLEEMLRLVTGISRFRSPAPTRARFT